MVAGWLAVFAWSFFEIHPRTYLKLPVPVQWFEWRAEVQLVTLRATQYDKKAFLGD